jgi:hypothetical protein
MIHFSHQDRSGPLTRTGGIVTRIREKAAARLDRDGTDAQVVEAVQIRTVAVSNASHIAWRVQGVVLLGIGSSALFFEVTSAWRFLGLPGLLLTAAGVVWMFLPLLREDPQASARLTIPRVATLVLTDRDVRVYRYAGAVVPDLQELHLCRPVDEIVAAEGPHLAVTGNLQAHRVALQFSDGKVLIVDVPEGQHVEAVQRAMDTITRRLRRR